MSDELATLQIRVQSLEATVADKRLANLSRSGAKAERATDGLTASFKRFVGPAVLAAGAVASLTKITSVTREFNVLNAQLITATGSAEKAEIAFDAIQQFAEKTPYDLQQATEGFVKLVNLGLTPSEKALTSYGDTASAMGKDLNQLIEAVADAATGEFERLKEFGIKAKSEGDNVSFTFRGVTTTVKKNAAEIENYLIQLGENNFAGAMAQRMDTLDGALSNLGDSWDKLWLEISEQGIGDLIEESVRLAIDVLDELTAMIASGELQAYLDAIGSKFEGWGRDIATTLDIVMDLWDQFLGSEEGEGIAGSTDSTIDFILDAFKNIPENIRAFIQLAAVEFAAIVDYAKYYGEAFVKVLGYEFAEMVEKAKVYGRAMGEALNPFSDDTFDMDAELRKLEDVADEMADEAFSSAEKQIEYSRKARQESIEWILKERDAALDSFDAQVIGARNLRAQYDEMRNERASSTEDVLAQFGKGADADDGPSEAERKKEAKEQAAREKAFEQLRLSLRTEEEEIQESYNRRLAIILANTEEGSRQQAELKARLDEEFATAAIGDLAQPDTYEEQKQQLEEFYQSRRDLILNNVKLTEEERTALEEELTKQRNERLAQLEQQRTRAILQGGEQLFGSLAEISKNFAGEQSDVYKAMFAISKAFALADSVIKIQQGIANAASLPFPANLGAMASVVSATAGIITTISGQEFSGAYDTGGFIPAGKVGLVGEYGPELISGPTNVTSRRETAEMFRAMQNQGQAQAPQVQSNTRIVNVIDPSIMGDYLTTDEGEELIINIMKRNQRAVA